MRSEVAALARLGPLPNDSLESDADVLREQQRLLAAIATQPPTAEESAVLATLFPADGGTSFGLAWSLVTIIESGSSWPQWDVLAGVQPDWRATLEVRLTNAGIWPKGRN